MPDTIAQPPAPPTAMSDATLFHRARMLVGSAVGACVFYGFFTNAARGTCTSDVVASGDWAGADAAQTCTTVTLVPSVLVYLAVALVVMRAMTIVLQHSATTDDALRTLRRARAAVVTIAIGSLVLAHAWFAAIATGDPWAPTGNAVLPSFIAWVEIETTTGP
jgi:hypothetical protein